MRSAYAAAIAITMQATVSNAGPEYAVIGVGATSCGSWVSNLPLRRHSMSWVLGFLTAMNMHEASLGRPGELSKGTDADGLELWITNYCSANPLADVSEAAFRLYVTLKNR